MTQPPRRARTPASQGVAFGADHASCSDLLPLLLTGMADLQSPQKGLVQKELDGCCGPQWGLGFRGALSLGCPPPPFSTYFLRMQSSRNSYEPLGDKTTRSLLRPHEVTLGGSWWGLGELVTKKTSRDRGWELSASPHPPEESEPGDTGMMDGAHERKPHNPSSTGVRNSQGAGTLHLGEACGQLGQDSAQHPPELRSLCMAPTFPEGEQGQTGVSVNSH